MNLILLKAEDYSLSAPDIAVLKDRRFIHCRDVIKPAIGDHLSVGVLGGLLGTGKIVGMYPDAIHLHTNLHTPPPAPANISLLLALPRPKVLRRMLISAVTLGVKEIHFVNSWRVEKSFWESPVLQADRLNQITQEALEQAKDTIAPAVHLHRRFKPFVEDNLPDILSSREALLAHPAAKEPVSPLEIDKKACLAVGPEGGFITYEIEKLVELGFKTVHIGPRILRVETAVPALIGALQLSR